MGKLKTRLYVWFFKWQQELKKDIISQVILHRKLESFLLIFIVNTPHIMRRKHNDEYVQTIFAATMAHFIFTSDFALCVTFMG